MLLLLTLVLWNDDLVYLDADVNRDVGVVIGCVQLEVCNRSTFVSEFSESANLSESRS